MPRIYKRKKKAYTNREKVQIFRRTQAILKECRMNGRIDFEITSQTNYQALKRPAFNVNEKKSAYLAYWNRGR